MSEHTFEPETRPEHCYDWITPEDVTRLAHLAFKVSKESSRPPQGERFVIDGRSWSGRENFCNDLEAVFSMLLRARAHELGVGEFPRDAALAARNLADLAVTA